ncbi:MAG: four-helix bundle copper-binding protein [Oscillospiraceae bacterium]
MGMVSNLTTKYQKCIDACKKCGQACDECFTLCLSEPDVQARKSCISTLVDCAGICSLAGCTMARDSQFSKDVCSLCAAVCEKCASECAMFTDDHCVKCANECRACAGECRAMA